MLSIRHGVSSTSSALKSTIVVATYNGISGAEHRKKSYILTTALYLLSE
jgi:hypothetical protein